MKLLCFGDLHLGAGSQYGRTPGKRLNDQVRVLEQIAKVAFDRHVHGVLFAGDAFEGPGIPPEQLQAFATFVAALRACDIPVLAVCGNGKHDAAVRETNGLAIFNHIDGITIAAQPGVHVFAGCEVATLPWVHPGRLIARAGRDVPRDEVNTIAADLLVDVARDLRAQCTGTVPAILLGHWAVSGTALPAGLPVDQLREPVLPVDELETLGYDAIVMGHIHRAQGLGASHDRHLLFDDARGPEWDGETRPTYGNATAVYTGSPLPLNFGEETVPHGVWILEPDGATKSTFVPIDSPRFITLDLGSNADVDWQLGQSIADAVGGNTDALDDAIIRVRFIATSEQMRRIDVAQLRAPLEQVARIVKVEPTIVREQRARVAGVDEQLDELQAVDLWLTANSIDGNTADAMRAKTREYLEVA